MAGTSSVYRIARSLLIGLTALLAIGVIGSFFMGVRATNTARQLATDEAVAIVQNSLPFVFTTADLATPASDIEADVMSADLARVVYDPTAYDDVAIYSPVGIIIYATDTSLIGQRPTEAHDPVRDAERGAITTDQSDGHFSVLAPLTLRDGGEMVAAVQLTRDDGPIAAAAGPWRFNAIFLGIALIVVGFLLWRIGRLSVTAVATQTFLSPGMSRGASQAGMPQPGTSQSGAARIANMTPRALEVPTPGLREEGEARRRAEERAVAAEQRLQVLQDQYRTTLDELHNVQRTLAERTAPPAGPDPETESRLLKSEGRVRLLEGQLQAMSAERDKIAKQMVEAATTPRAADSELEKRSRMVQQEAIGLRAELEGAQTELSLTRRQLDAIKEEAGRSQEMQQNFDSAQVEILHTKEALQASKMDAEQARAELADARAEMRALRTEEQRAAVLEEELRATRAERDSLKASHEAELVEREADFESMVRRTREEFQGELDAIQGDLKRQFAQREQELQEQQEQRESSFAAREAALTQKLIARETELTEQLIARETELTQQLSDRESELTQQLSARESELTGEIGAREAELRRRLEEREAELQHLLEERESNLGEELSDARQEAGAAAIELEAAHRELQSARDELTATRRETGDSQDQLRKANEELVRSQTEIETLQLELTAAQRVVAEANSELGIANAEVQAELGRGVELADRAERAEQGLRTERERAEQAEIEAQRIRAEAETEAQRIRAEAELIRADVDRARADAETARVESQELEERLATAAADHQRQIAELTAQIAERPDMDEILRASQERLATQTERLVEVEDRAHQAERELGQTLERMEEIETELRQVQMEKAMRDLRDQEAAAAAATHISLEDEGPIEDRRASTPFTQELSLDAKKTLSQILGLTQVMKYKQDGKDQGQLIKQLTGQVRRLEHTVSDLADVDALVKGSIELGLRRSDLEALVRRVVEESAVSGDHDVRVEAQPVVVGVDPQRTEQMLAGLLRASGERTATGKQITVRLSAYGGGALISVEDPEPSSDASLSPVVQRLAEVHGGWAKVESADGGGSKFQVFLPEGLGPKDGATVDATEARSPETLQIVVEAGATAEDEPWTDAEEALLVQELHRLSAED